MGSPGRGRSRNVGAQSPRMPRRHPPPPPRQRRRGPGNLGVSCHPPSRWRRPPGPRFSAAPGSAGRDRGLDTATGQPANSQSARDRPGERSTTAR
ncbi:hypothetical protein chiPu_0031408, partial [Chiloscyllium punctatum]|nr:hypothetical protein [Chiloscyllium punctatum]